MRKFRLSAEAAQEITAIFDHIAGGSIDAAERVRTEIYDALKKVAQNPGMGHKREDLTHRDLLFWPVYSYLIIYRPQTQPLEVVAVLHGRRDLKRLLEKR